MNLLNDFLLIVLSAIVLQNAIFTRGFGASKGSLMRTSSQKILSSLLAWPVQLVLLDRLEAGVQLAARYAATLASICIVYTAVWLLTKYIFPGVHYDIRNMLSSASFNSATLGSLLIAFSGSYGLVQTVGFALGSGIGYTLAILLLCEGRRRIALSDVPRAFRGMPVMLLYAGILSLAIYGLIGHQLPT